jgi:hypothetical protein
MNEVTVNVGQSVFVIPCGDGYTCLGFDVVRRKTQVIADWLGRSDLAPKAARGTLESYAEYQAIAKIAAATGKRCPAELHPRLIDHEGQRVEVTFDNGSTERFWVGKSTGWLPCHLRLHNTRSMGGMSVLPDEPIAAVRVLKHHR